MGRSDDPHAKVREYMKLPNDLGLRKVVFSIILTVAKVILRLNLVAYKEGITPA